jgi:3-hydroxy-5-methyl-1-naphthoate 3-O-methyltransferase
MPNETDALDCGARGIADAFESEAAAPLRAGFAPPAQPLGNLLEVLGIKMFARDHTLVQYVAWAQKTDLFELMGARGGVTKEDVCAHTILSEAGADSLLVILTAIGLATRGPGARYSLTRMACDYFLRSSPYCVGDQFRSRGGPLPAGYRKEHSRWLERMRFRLVGRLPQFRFGSAVRLRNQHARNLAACVAAVRTGEFAGLRCLVDIAGGSGAFAIPLALAHPIGRIVLTDLPEALDNIRPILARHGLAERIELLGMNAFHGSWAVPQCDGMFIGNFLHGFSDETCLRVCQEAFRSLAPGGKVWVHEMVWNDTRDGPLMTALMHAAMRSATPGGQRTVQEIVDLLRGAGFVDPYVVPTSGAFALVAARRPPGS